MLRKRKWLIIAVVAIAVVLVVGIIGGVVYAQTTTPTTDSQGKTLLARVAAILGIEEQKLEDAFKQAKNEMTDEALSKKLDALVEQGKITQEQADQYKEWWESRPDVPNIIDGKGLKGFGGGFGFRCLPGKGCFAPTPSVTQ